VPHRRLQHLEADSAALLPGTLDLQSYERDTPPPIQLRHVPSA